MEVFRAHLHLCSCLAIWGHKAYVGVHRGLALLSDEKVSSLAGSWFSLIVPSFVGGILAFILYILFLSNILDAIGATSFSKFATDANTPEDAMENFEKFGISMAWKFLTMQNYFSGAFLQG